MRMDTAPKDKLDPERLRSLLEASRARVNGLMDSPGTTSEVLSALVTELAIRQVRGLIDGDSIGELLNTAAIAYLLPMVLAKSGAAPE